MGRWAQKSPEIVKRYGRVSNDVALVDLQAFLTRVFPDDEATVARYASVDALRSLFAQVNAAAQWHIAVIVMANGLGDGLVRHEPEQIAEIFECDLHRLSKILTENQSVRESYKALIRRTHQRMTWTPFVHELNRLGIEPMACHRLRCQGVLTVVQLCVLDEKTLLRIRGMSRRRVEMIKTILAANGLQLKK